MFIEKFYVVLHHWRGKQNTEDWRDVKTGRTHDGRLAVARIANVQQRRIYGASGDNGCDFVLGYVSIKGAVTDLRLFLP